MMKKPREEFGIRPHTKHLWWEKPIREAIRMTVKEIFDNLEKARQNEVKRLKKYDSANWKKGNEEDGRKSTTSILTMGINVRTLLNDERKKWLGEDEEK